MSGNGTAGENIRRVCNPDRSSEHTVGFLNSIVWPPALRPCVDAATGRMAGAIPTTLCSIFVVGEYFLQVQAGV